MHSIGTPEPVGIGFRRALITGAGGFVGRRIAARLATFEYLELFAADRSLTPVSGASSFRMDLGQPDHVDRVLRETRPDLVIHLAAQSSVGQGVGASGATWMTNVCGSLYLAEAIGRHTPDATVLFASSAEVYGNAFNNGVVTEATPPQPQSAYAKSKLAAEYMFADVLPASAQLIVARPANHSGAGQDQRFVLPSFAAQLMAGSQVIKVGNLTAGRDFTHVENVVDGYIALLNCAENLPNRTVFNIGSGETRSVGALLDQMIRMSGRQCDVVVDPERLRPVDVPVAGIDVSLLQSTTGWKPARSTENMLSDLLKAPDH